MNNLKWIFLPVLLIVAFISGCKKDEITTDPSATISFSADTILFDTVFTTIGSTTSILKVYNNNDQALSISSIQLEGGSGSMYRMNVDGLPGNNFSDIEIEANDSLFIFVEVTVDPGNVNLPFVVEDRILFRTNGNDQEVQLTAWGQDANFHGGLDGIFGLECDEVWNPDKPHVVYGIVAVEEGCKLTINAGTQVYCHRGAGLLVYRGCLDVLGQLNNEVVFQGDRLEPQFQDTPGQWGIELEVYFENQFGVQTASIARGGMWFLEAEPSNIDYAILRNGTIGIQVDTLKTQGDDPIRITNTKINNMSGIGMLGRGANMSGYNNLVTNCGQACGAFTLGGKYQFDHCTFANYWSDATRQDPTFVLNNFYRDANNQAVVRPLVDTEFKNCIMWGNNASLSDFNEFVAVMQESDAIDPPEYVFTSCAVDTDVNVENSANFQFMVNGQSPPFVSVSNNDYHLNTSSSIWQTVTLSDQAFVDLDGVQRFSNIEKGCYELP